MIQAIPLICTCSHLLAIPLLSSSLACFSSTSPNKPLADFAADGVDFRGEALESLVDVDEKVEARREKMREKLAKRKVWRGPSETALL